MDETELRYDVVLKALDDGRSVGRGGKGEAWYACVLGGIQTYC